jgi:hypothetical protein
MTTPRLLLAAVLLALPSAAIAQPCTPHFVPGYGTAASLSGTITAAAMFRGQLIASGQLTVGGISTRFARFNGQSWEVIPTLTTNGNVLTMVSRTEGGAEVMYFGGAFTTVNGQPVNVVARWDGNSVTTFPGLPNSFAVEAIEFFDDGTGAALHVGMRMGAMKWTGSGWTNIGMVSGGAGNPIVRTLRAFNDGTGTKLFAGGCFTSIGGQAIHSVAAWNGTSWQAANGGLLPQENFPTDIYDLELHDDGFGPKLLAAGCINTVARNWGDTAVARFDGGAWTSVMFGVATDQARAATTLLSTVENGAPVLYATAGTFVEDPRHVRRFAGGVWTDVGGNIVFGDTIGIGPGLRALIMTPDASGQPGITAFGMVANGALRWTGSAWSTIESWNNTTAPVAGACIAVDPADTDGVYWVDGVPRKDHTQLSNTAPVDPTRGIARFTRNGQSLLVFAGLSETAVFDGASWTTLAPIPDATIQVLRTGRDTGGETAFLAATANGAAQVYKLEGAQWASVGPPIALSNGTVRTLCTFDSGSGPEIYLGGTISPIASRYLVRLVNNQWLDVPGVDGPVRDLIVHDVGQGPELLMAGDFIATTGLTSGGVSRWNGTRIAPVGAGLGVGLKGSAFAVFNNGTGPRLYIGAEGNNPLRVWDGGSWVSLGAFSPGAAVNGIAPITRASGNPSLMIVGNFTAAGGVPATNLAEYSACRPVCTSDFNGDGDFGTDQDVEAFFACLAGHCCATCLPGGSDFNGDGDFGTDQDIESFFRVLAGGAC